MNDLEIVSIKNQIEDLASEGKQIVIADNASFEGAGAFLRRLKQVQKELDEKRKARTRPLDEAKKLIMNDYKPVEEKLAEMESSIKASMIQYQKIVDERIRLELEEKRKKDEAERAEQEKDAAFFGDTEGVEIEASRPEDQLQTRAPVASGFSTREVWDFEVVNADLVPREYCSPDPKKMRGAVDFGARDVKGLRIFSKTVATARR